MCVGFHPLCIGIVVAGDGPRDNAWDIVRVMVLDIGAGSRKCLRMGDALQRYFLLGAGSTFPDIVGGVCWLHMRAGY